MNTSQNTKADRIAEIRAYASMGSENFHRHFSKRIIFTDAVKMVAEAAEAFWLIDAIASHQPGIEKKFGDLSTDDLTRGLADFQVWTLEVSENGSAVLLCRADSDAPATVLARQVITYTDFPIKAAPLTLWVVGSGTRTLCLPEEY